MSSDAWHEAEQALTGLMVGREFPQFSKQTYASALQACTEELRGIFGPLAASCAEDGGALLAAVEPLCLTLGLPPTPTRPCWIQTRPW